MVRIVGFAALFAPVLGARITSQGQHVARGLEVLSQLKDSPDDVQLQNEYRELLGDVEWGENQIFLETGVKMVQEPVALGEEASDGRVLTMIERTGFAESFGRWLTNRRDYVFEQEARAAGHEGATAKYALDGNTLSLHSRMHVFHAGDENPRFILRRAFNYLNPIAGIFGQFVYRVIQCTDAHDGQCGEGDILYTITKDRLGRGALWGMDEYRVYLGTGGCGRWGHGLIGCDQDAQLGYSLGSGLSEVSFDTDFFRGNIISINRDRESGTISRHGRNVGVAAGELQSMKVAHTTKIGGPARWVNWVGRAIPAIGTTVEFFRALIWTDSYRLRFEGGSVGGTDELLVALCVAAQDLTRDVIQSRAVVNAAQGAASSVSGGASVAVGGGTVAVEGGAAVAAGGVAVEAGAAGGVAVAR